MVTKKGRGTAFFTANLFDNNMICLTNKNYTWNIDEILAHKSDLSVEIILPKITK